MNALITRVVFGTPDVSSMLGGVSGSFVASDANAPTS